MCSAVSEQLAVPLIAGVSHLLSLLQAAQQGRKGVKSSGLVSPESQMHKIIQRVLANKLLPNSVPYDSN